MSWSLALQPLNWWHRRGRPERSPPDAASPRKHPRHSPNLPSIHSSSHRVEIASMKSCSSLFSSAAEPARPAVRLGRESRGPHVRYPDLQWSQATLSHPSSVLADLSLTAIPQCYM